MASDITDEQRAAVLRLADSGVLTAQQAEAVLGALVSPAESSETTTESPQQGREAPTVGARPWSGRRGVFFELLAYAGAALVLAAGVSVFALTWDELTRGSQVTVLAVITGVLLLAGIAFGGGPRALPRSAGPRQRVVSLLLAFAGVGLAATVGVAHTGYVGDLDWAATGFVAILLGYLVVPAAPTALLSCLFSAWLVIHLADRFDGDWVGSPGVALLLAGLLWGVLALLNVLRQRTTFLACGLIIALVGAQWMQTVSMPWGYGLTAAFAVACFAGFFVRREAVLLAGGVVGLTLAVPEAVWDFTEGALGGPVVVLIAGAVLLVTAALGVRWDRVRTRGSTRTG